MSLIQQGLMNEGKEGREGFPSGQIIEMQSFQDKLFNIFDQIDNGTEKKALVFSACNSGDGISSICYNSALSLSSQGKKILLVDGNFRAPVMHKQFRFIREKGLSDIINDHCSLDEAIKKSKIQSLWVMTSGNAVGNIPSFFSSDKIYDLIRDLKKEFEYILIDSAPLIPFTETPTLAAKSDGLILILKAGKTKWEVAQAVKNNLVNKHKVNLLGTVLNNQRHYIPRFIYNNL